MLLVTIKYNKLTWQYDSIMPVAGKAGKAPRETLSLWARLAPVTVRIHHENLLGAEVAIEKILKKPRIKGAFLTPPTKRTKKQEERVAEAVRRTHGIIRTTKVKGTRLGTVTAGSIGAMITGIVTGVGLALMGFDEYSSNVANAVAGRAGAFITTYPPVPAAFKVFSGGGVVRMLKRIKKHKTPNPEEAYEELYKAVSSSWRWREGYLELLIKAREAKAGERV